MPTREERFNQTAERQRARLARIQREHVRRIVAELERAQARVIRLLRSAPTAAGTAHWLRVREEIERLLERFREAASATTAEGIAAALVAGRALMAEPLAAAGLASVSARFALNPRALMALRAAALDRIRDVTDQARRRIGSAIAQAMLGALRTDQAIALVNRILGGNARRRAMTIVYTEVGRAYSLASFESMQQAEAIGVRFARRWQQSGKLHPRVSHVIADGQLVRGTKQPFLITDPKTGESETLRFPRDPHGSAGNTINCGCIAVPVVDGGSFEQLDPRTGELVRYVVSLPDDPNAAPVLRAETEAESIARATATVDAFNARMRAMGFGGGGAGLAAQPVRAAGLAVVNDAGAQGLLAGGAGGGGGAGLPPLLPGGWDGFEPWELASVVGLAPALAQAVLVLEREIVTRPNEWGFVLDDFGEVLHRQEGMRDRILLQGLSTLLARGKVFSHNHPLGRSPGLPDVFTAAGYDFAELRAVATRRRWRLLPPVGGWRLVDIYHQRHEIMRAAEQRVARAGVLTEAYDERLAEAQLDELVRRNLVRVQHYTP